MRIGKIIWLPDIVEKIDRKHGVQPWEVEQVISGWVDARKLHVDEYGVKMYTWYWGKAWPDDT